MYEPSNHSVALWLLARQVARTEKNINRIVFIDTVSSSQDPAASNQGAAAEMARATTSSC